MSGLPLPLFDPDPSTWVGDMRRHRTTSGSVFCWTSQDAMTLALRWSRGLVEVSSLSDYRRLDQQLLALMERTHTIEKAASPLLDVAREQCRPRDWAEGIRLVGYTELHVNELRSGIILDIHKQPYLEQPEIRRVLDLDLPYKNPFTYAWEVRAMHGMYRAAEDLLTDALCDLIEELVPDHGWETLAALAAHPTNVASLQWRVERQRERHGGVGDPRRQVTQTFGPADPLLFAPTVIAARSTVANS